MILGAIVYVVALLMLHTEQPVEQDTDPTAQRLDCTITGTPGNDDDVRGTPEPDVICGFGGQDQIFARLGADVVYGGRGVDTLVGRSGKDRLYGGRGDDMIIGRGGLDVHSGQRGRDCLAGKSKPAATAATRSESGAGETITPLTQVN